MPPPLLILKGLRSVANPSGFCEPRISFSARRVSPVPALRLLSAAGVFLILSLSLAATGCGKKVERDAAWREVEAPKAAAPGEEAQAPVPPRGKAQQPEGEKQPANAALPRKIIYN